MAFAFQDRFSFLRDNMVHFVYRDRSGMNTYGHINRCAIAWRKHHGCPLTGNRIRCEEVAGQQESRLL